LPEDLRCEQLFTENCTRLVRLLSTSEFESLGDSYCLARRRVKSLEAKLDRNPAQKAQYSAFLRDYIDLGHMSLVTKEPSETQFFLPHHCGDICTMYRCVRVLYPDDFLQCIVWREGSTEQLSVFKLNTVTYVTKLPFWL